MEYFRGELISAGMCSFVDCDEYYWRLDLDYLDFDTRPFQNPHRFAIDVAIGDHGVDRVESADSHGRSGGELRRQKWEIAYATAVSSHT